MADDNGPEKALELIEKIKVGMLTYLDGHGHLVSKPLATQDVDDEGNLWFIVERDSHKVHGIEQRPEVNVAYASHGAWVSVCGSAEIVDDTEKLKQLWSAATDTWMQGGPDNPDNTLLRVVTHDAEFWDSPGGKVVALARLVRARATGERYEGENETVDLDARS